MRFPLLFTGLVFVAACGDTASPGADDEPGSSGQVASTTGDSTSTSTSTTDVPSTTASEPTSSPTTATTATSTVSSSASASASESDSDAESSGSTGMDSASFIVEPDGGGSGCVERRSDRSGFSTSFECSTWDQDCCLGEKCTAWANDGGTVWNASRCVPVDPEPGSEGSVCTVMGSDVTGQDDCDVGLMCVSVDPETLQGRCAAFCQGDWSTPVCDDAASTCVISNEGDLSLCRGMCDPLSQNCDHGDACFGFGEPGEGGPTVCLETGGDVYFGTTDRVFVNDCEPGTTGVDPSLIGSCADGEPCCATWCDTTDAMACEDGQTCTAWDNANGTVGVCLG